MAIIVALYKGRFCKIILLSGPAVGNEQGSASDAPNFRERGPPRAEDAVESSNAAYNSAVRSMGYWRIAQPRGMERVILPLWVLSTDARIGTGHPIYG